tara:strand:+ start:7958 stop:8524 length:567 start_codon:yes stop_codon:yes gene_type:complete
MKKYFLLVLLITVVSSTSLFAGKNSVRLGVEAPRVMSLEYERSFGILLPGFSVFANYGSGDFDLDGDKTSVSGLNFGARYKIPILGYISIGYGNLDIDYSYVASVNSGSVTVGQTVDVDGSFSGLLIEYGKEFGVGPVFLGGKVSYIAGEPSVSGTAGGTAISDDDIDSGAAELKGLPGFAFYVGYSF